MNIPEMPTRQEQSELLLELRTGGEYGILLILSRPGDVVFAVSPVPKLAGFEICCASPQRLYDIWKDGKLISPDRTRKQIRAWIKENTPVWLYDDSKITEEQMSIVSSWIDAVYSRYTGFTVEAKL